MTPPPIDRPTFDALVASTGADFVRELVDTFLADAPDMIAKLREARRLIAEPGQLDVVLLPNLYGDVLSDAAAGLIGGLGLAPSGCFGDDYAYFESAHGTAPDIAGRHIINPTATLLSAALMLEYLGFEDAARRLERAIDATYEKRDALPPDQGGSASTSEFCAAVERRL